MIVCVESRNRMFTKVVRLFERISAHIIDILPFTALVCSVTA